jgi:hypothetical protein
MLHAIPQVSSSAYAAARDYWPDVFSSVDAAQQQQVMDGLRSTRPVLVWGYESMVMARMLLEDPACVDAILADWHPLLHKTLDRWGVALFCGVLHSQGLLMALSSEIAVIWQPLCRKRHQLCSI